MRSGLFSRAEFKPVTASAWLLILALPCINLISGFILRDHAGPFWLWSNLDPDYWYLLDSLNLINLNWPVHIPHPGTPLQLLGAILIKGMHPFSSAQEITQMVLSQPERYLHVINAALVFLNTAALAFVGWCSYQVFQDHLAVVLLQIGPFISKLSIKWMTHVAPEPMLITTVLVLGGVALLALRPGQLEENRTRYAVAFGVIAGFGMATKITSVGVYFLPIFLLWTPRSLFLYGLAGLAAMVFFTLPAAGSYGDIIGHIHASISGSGAMEGTTETVSQGTSYVKEFIRVSSRPAFFVVFLASLVLVLYLGIKSLRAGQAFPPAGRLLAGLCIADLMQALIVAKHPSGHYMVPVLVLSTLGMVVIYRALLEEVTQAGKSALRVRAPFAVLCAGLLIAQASTLIKLDKQFIERSQAATSIDDKRFSQCARIYFWAAATPSYALQLGNHMVGNAFSEPLKTIRPANDFWFDVLHRKFLDWTGDADITAVASAYPCLYARGAYPGLIRPFFEQALPELEFSTACTPAGAHETLFTSRVDCQGNPQ